MNILTAALAGGAQHPYLGAFLLLVFGAFCFFGGFYQYRAYRILIDAPKAHVRSIPMGLVHLHGKATGEPLISPLTGTRCFLFVANVEQWMKTRTRNGVKWSWRTVAGDDDLKEFYLDDGTGRVLVNPVGADQGDMGAQRTFYCEIGKDGHFKSAKPAPGIAAPSEQAVWTYIHGVHRRHALEHMFELEGERGRMMKSVVESSMKVMNAVERIENFGSGGQTSVEVRPGGGPYRVTEECFPADSDCVVVGTCAENASPTDSRDRNIIRRGENEKTFLISTQGERGLGRKLRVNAIILVGLGVALILGATALALGAVGLL